MSGGRFWVNHREVLNIERILIYRSLLKENLNFWKEGLKPVQKNNSILLDILTHQESEIQEFSLSKDSKEMAYITSGYITKKEEIIKYFQCETCSLVMQGNNCDDATEKAHFD